MMEMTLRVGMRRNVGRQYAFQPKTITKMIESSGSHFQWKEIMLQM